jgi:hypothetical protein
MLSSSININVFRDVGGLTDVTKYLVPALLPMAPAEVIDGKWSDRPSKAVYSSSQLVTFLMTYSLCFLMNVEVSGFCPADCLRELSKR